MTINSRIYKTTLTSAENTNKSNNLLSKIFDYSLFYGSIIYQMKKEKEENKPKNYLIKKQVIQRDQQHINNTDTLITPSALSQKIKVNSNRSERIWKKCELYKFAAFIHYHKNKLKEEDLRKQSKIFKMMSGYIQTRNSNQCRSHSHKLIKQFGSIEAVLLFLSESLPDYQRFVEQEKDAIDKLIFPLVVVAKERRQNQMARKDISEDLKHCEGGDRNTANSSKYQKGKTVEAIFEDDSEQDKSIEQLRPTDSDYHQDGKQPQSKSSGSQRRSILNLDLTDIVKPSITTVHEINHKNRMTSGFNLPINNNRDFIAKDQQNIMEWSQTFQTNVSQSWLECHNLFLQWRFKLTNLLQKQNVNIR